MPRENLLFSPVEFSPKCHQRRNTLALKNLNEKLLSKTSLQDKPKNQFLYAYQSFLSYHFHK